MYKDSALPGSIVGCPTESVSQSWEIPQLSWSLGHPLAEAISHRPFEMNSGTSLAAASSFRLRRDSNPEVPV